MAAALIAHLVQRDCVFNAVYHIAHMHHWKRVVKEQFPLLLANDDLNQVHVSIACQTDAEQGEVLQYLNKLSNSLGSKATLSWYRSRLEDFEHMAMVVVEAVAREQALPVLYFHAKGVSRNPPSRDMETFRMHVNQIVREADRWASFLTREDYDACGPLLTLDEKTEARYFAGNFWMARAEYLRKLPPYREFAGAPAFGKKAWDRHLAEIAINRTGQMNPFAIDGTSLTTRTITGYFRSTYGTNQTIRRGPANYDTPLMLIAAAENSLPPAPSSEFPPAPPHQ